jgi:hypothetical protein
VDDDDYDEDDGITLKHFKAATGHGRHNAV